MPLFQGVREEVGELPTTVTSQYWEHIGHHCHCNDEQLDCDLLHGITSFLMD